MPAQRVRCATGDGENGPVEAAVDARTITKRDIEATFKQLGFSNRRSKAGAVAAWKAMSGEEESEPVEDDPAAEFFIALRRINP
jgi:hypothetical protein